MALAKPFVDQIYDEVKSWDGYKFRVGKYGTQPFTKILDGASEDFEKNLVEGVSKICKNLGPVIDNTFTNNEKINLDNSVVLLISNNRINLKPF